MSTESNFYNMPETIKIWEIYEDCLFGVAIYTWTLVDSEPTDTYTNLPYNYGIIGYRAPLC